MKTTLTSALEKFQHSLTMTKVTSCLTIYKKLLKIIIIFFRHISRWASDELHRKPVNQKICQWDLFPWSKYNTRKTSAAAKKASAQPKLQIQVSLCTTNPLYQLSLNIIYQSFQVIHAGLENIKTYWTKLKLYFIAFSQ